MLSTDYTAKILDLKDVIINDVENDGQALKIHLELPVCSHKCPSCGQKTKRIHDYRVQIVKDIPLGRKTYLYLKKRRYLCPHCQKRFYEENYFLPRYHRVTSRMIAKILNEFRKLRSAKEIAESYNVSATTAIRYFDHVNYRCNELPVVVSIDEFKGNAGGEKYQCVITNPEGRKVLDILPNRFESSLIRYFERFKNKNDVRFFVTDMNPHFKAVAKACFPQATIVADRYHVIRQVIWAMENVRKNEQKNLSPKFRKYFKRSKSLLCKSMDRLKSEEKSALALMFEISPRLALAYRLKNYFMLVMHSQPSKTPDLLGRWLLLAEHYAMPEFKSCVTAYHNWSVEIVNAVKHPWSNGFTEGCNNKTKVLKRICFGVRNFHRFRNRILHCSS